MKTTIGIIAGIIVIGLIAMFATGYVDVDQTEAGELPEVEIEGGNLPEFDIDTGEINVTTEEETVLVPKVVLEEETVEVPEVEVVPADEEVEPEAELEDENQ